MLLRKRYQWLTVNLFSDTVLTIPEPCVVARLDRLALTLLTLKELPFPFPFFCSKKGGGQ